VCNTSVALESLGKIDFAVVNQFSELDNLSNFFEGKNFPLLVSIDTQAGGIISTVF
jgi:hypothetical protein